MIALTPAYNFWHISYCRYRSLPIFTFQILGTRVTYPALWLLSPQPLKNNFAIFL
ncbi:hypothetical protein BPUTEOMOX_1432 [methanotrophic endosymbiont of Bathymodiolus puteoserpentis (Logatchev)]|nr:hypothetical protein BPUTEOMOX_1432 [methanotrophic endosymbiont of Bathymodiolus puteoserpentis (Logatchev)]